MIPLRDVIPSRTFPVFTISFIVLNSLAFLYEQLLPAQALERFIHMYGVVPARFESVTLLTSTFLHAGWAHFLGNMLFLWIFGDNVEDRLGHVRYAAFYLLCGAAAALAHVYMNPISTIPTIGASGAIAGIMGGYFVLYPQSRVLALVPLFFYFEVIEVPAIVFLGLWFLMQFFYGVGSMAVRTAVEAGGVAFWAHIAGFIAGMAGVLVLKKSSRSRWSVDVT